MKLSLYHGFFFLVSYLIVTVIYGLLLFSSMGYYIIYALTLFFATSFIPALIILILILILKRKIEKNLLFYNLLFSFSGFFIYLLLNITRLDSLFEPTLLKGILSLLGVLSYSFSVNILYALFVKGILSKYKIPTYNNDIDYISENTRKYDSASFKKIEYNRED